jgi:hypothetical protein
MNAWGLQNRQTKPQIGMQEDVAWEQRLLQDLGAVGPPAALRVKRQKNLDPFTNQQIGHDFLMLVSGVSRVPSEAVLSHN